MSLRDRLRNDPVARRRLRIAAIVMAAVLVLVVLPGYLASLPGFFGRYPTLSVQHEEWSTSSHLQVGCEGCHVPPRPLPRAAFRVRMVGEFYLSLVSRNRTPNLFPRPTNAACLDCHSELRTSSPKGDLQIPHRAHITVLKMECVQCHSHLVHAVSAEGGHQPTMAECLTCHDGDTAKNACTACHTGKAAPESHSDAGWLVAHADHASDPACLQCHKWTERWCLDCHKDRPLSHTADWRATHGQQVATHRNCEACHSDAFCVECHGALPALNYDPSLKLVE
jgi:hypothetical protein